MAKLLLAQTLFLIICWFAFVSGAIKQKKKFETFINNNVIGKFRPWAQTHNGEQFAVPMLMDEDKNWDKFKFSPEPSDDANLKAIVQPNNVDKMVNYIAVIPGKTKNGKKKERFFHSEQRIYDKYLEPMLLNYLTEKKGAPEAMVLYSWIVPCYQQSWPSTGTTGCTSHTLQALKNMQRN